MYTSTRPNKKT